MAGTERDAVPGFVLGVVLVTLGTVLNVAGVRDPAGVLLVLIGAAFVVEAQVRA